MLWDAPRPTGRRCCCPSCKDGPCIAQERTKKEVKFLPSYFNLLSHQTCGFVVAKQPPYFIRQGRSHFTIK